jgi:rhodanese-related sulfurtransferase
MTVLKVMFTAIVVAMTLIFLSSALQVLDFQKVYVSDTYLKPGIVGGLIMGVGFIIGGFCPGTSIVSAATFKIDGMVFVGGVAFGSYLFGEGLPLFKYFSNSTYMGKFMLPELFGISTGAVVLLVVIMALAMFYGAGISEKVFGEGKALKDIDLLPDYKGAGRAKFMAALLLIILALVTLLKGQPGLEARWSWIEEEELAKINTREVFIHPGEMLETMNQPLLYKTILDVRSKGDYGKFHLQDAVNVRPESIVDGSLAGIIGNRPSHNVNILVSNDEEAAVDAYKKLRAQGVINLYILSGGINMWLDMFPLSRKIAVKKSGKTGDSLKFDFKKEVGELMPQSNPGGDIHYKKKKIAYKKKIKIKVKKVISGGCG